MLTPDEHGKYWHRGTKIGLIYALTAFLLFVVTMTEDNSDGPLYWLPKIGLFFVLLPLAAASHAYSAGKRDRTLLSKPLDSPIEIQDGG